MRPSRLRQLVTGQCNCAVLQSRRLLCMAIAILSTTCPATYGPASHGRPMQTTSPNCIATGARCGSNKTLLGREGLFCHDGVPPNAFPSAARGNPDTCLTQLAGMQDKRRLCSGRSGAERGVVAHAAHHRSCRLCARPDAHEHCHRELQEPLEGEPSGVLISPACLHAYQ